MVNRGRQSLRVLVVGHFALDGPCENGQIAKTRICFDELRVALGKEHVRAADTSWYRRVLLATVGAFLKDLLWTNTVLVMPGSRAVRWVLPPLAAWRVLLGRQLHVIAIGSSLGRAAQGSWLLRFLLNRCDGVHVETTVLREELNGLGLRRVRLLPNMRQFDSVRMPDATSARHVRAVFISRILPSKGVELAIESVRAANAHSPGSFTLDIYGPVPAEHTQWFATIQRRCTQGIRYCGVLPFPEVQATLREYDVLLFPTTYSSEGFAGVMLEGMISGLAVLTSDWLANHEFIRDGVNGFLLPPDSADAFATKLLELDHDRELLLTLQRNSAACAHQYHAPGVMSAFIDHLVSCAPSGCGS